MSRPGPSTRVVRAGLPEPEQGEPFLPGPVFAAPFHLSGDPYVAPTSYTATEIRPGPATRRRSGASRTPRRCCSRPGWRRPRRCSGRPEAGLRARDGLRLLPRRPRAHRGAPRAQDRGAAGGAGGPRGGGARRRPAVARVAVEPGGARVYDLAALAGLGVTTVVDNTTAGPLLQRPLDLGATYALTSATKQMSGHADLMLGYVTTRDADRAQALRDWRRQAVSIPGPFEVWLAHRSLPTLALRLERGCDNASPVAGCRRATTSLACATRPARRSRARRGPPPDGRLRDGGLLRSRERGARRGLAGGRRAGDRRRSFGSVHTVAERRARWGGDAVPEGFIRLSAGCEDTADLLADVEQALDGRLAGLPARRPVGIAAVDGGSCG